MMFGVERSSPQPTTASSALTPLGGAPPPPADPAATENGAAPPTHATLANLHHTTGALPGDRVNNDSPPTSPPSSEAPPPSDDEFTSFILRRAAKRLGVDYNPERRISPVRRGPSASLPRSGSAGGAHPIDSLRAHHWQDQLSADDMSTLPQPKFPATLKTARPVAMVERRLQEPPPCGLQRFSQFVDCTRDEIARMIEIRERSLGETHGSVPPLYDVLGDMLLFEGEVAQAERYYSIALQRMESRSTLLQQQAAQAAGSTEAGKRAAADQLLSQAANWSYEVAALQSKLGMLWMQAGRSDAAQAAFLKAAQLANPGVDISLQFGPGGSLANVASPNPSTNQKTGGGSTTASSTARPGEAPSSSHLRHLLSGLNKDRSLIANALAERVLGSRGRSASNDESPASASVDATSTTIGGRARTPTATGPGDAAASNSVQYSDDDADPNLLDRSVSAPTGRGKKGREPSTPRSYSASTPATLHDASSLKRLVDSVGADGRTEESRRRMRAQITGMQGTSLSPTRRTVHDTLRKTKDLQDIISRIRTRADLMPQP